MDETVERVVNTPSLRLRRYFPVVVDMEALLGPYVPCYSRPGSRLESDTELWDTEWRSKDLPIKSSTINVSHLIPISSYSWTNLQDNSFLSTFLVSRVVGFETLSELKSLSFVFVKILLNSPSACLFTPFVGQDLGDQPHPTSPWTILITKTTVEFSHRFIFWSDIFIYGLCSTRTVTHHPGDHPYTLKIRKTNRYKRWYS